ncbi:hypothetical protein NQ314_008526 [Rhamnusium bicolor]|uniref:Protein kinase domain-containing protein n=1 Tax=Rhamnusium bicolor TaxID=1586634 RepID=A0AAV8YBQ9_9CUCU|nr:hypothetical protein NQ314_008526 [Rhamnusium bicolor]
MTRYEGNISAYKTISILGHCFEGTAVVHLAKHISSGAMVAIKKFDMDKIKEGAHLVEREIILTKQLHHSNLITYHTAFVSGPDVCVVSPLMAYGSCRDLLSRHFNDGLPEQAIITIIRDVFDGLDYLHRKGYIHRAIRASHILISAAGRACLSGLRYACPIVLNGRWQRSIHSFPATNGTEPFAGMSKTLMLTEKVRGCIPQLLDSTTLPRNENMECSGDCEVSNNVVNRRFSEDLHELAGLCLHREAYDRPTAGQLLTHPVFKTHKKSLTLPELLRPALPLSDRVAYDTGIFTMKFFNDEV